LTDIWFKRVIRDQNKYFDTNYRHFRHWKILSCHDLGYQMSIFKKKTVYQIEAFNLFFIMEFTSWKYLITFISYTNKRTENTCSGFPPLKNTVLPRFRASNVNIFLKTLYQIKAFNIFFIMEFTSWKYFIPFKSYTYKRTGKYLSCF
jgi:hypothetical protein